MNVTFQISELIITVVEEPSKYSNIYDTVGFLNSIISWPNKESSLIVAINFLSQIAIVYTRTAQTVRFTDVLTQSFTHPSFGAQLCLIHLAICFLRQIGQLFLTKPPITTVVIEFLQFLLSLSTLSYRPILPSSPYNWKQCSKIYEPILVSSSRIVSLYFTYFLATACASDSIISAVGVIKTIFSFTTSWNLKLFIGK